MKRPVIFLIHAGYWLLYSILLVFIIMAVNANSPHGPLHVKGLGNVFLTPFGALSIFPAVFGFYAFYSVIFPNYLQKKRWQTFALAVIIACPLSSVVSALLMSCVFGSRIMFNDGWGSAIPIALFMVLLSALHGVIALVIRGFITWYGDIKIKEELTKKNYEMELELVKSQISPHFLFNTINNIDVLIQKDPEKASGYLNKLSDIMRFMLYETKTEKVPLQKEVEYAEKYIALQKIRAANTGYVNYSVSGKPEGHQVEPMLFIPFIENAFKHADKKSEQAITIHFNIAPDKTIFECENHYTAHSGLKPEHHGIGNELIKKRLELLYKDKHRLTILDENKVYKVKLELDR